MGAGGFHVRVRDGIGWGAAAMATGHLTQSRPLAARACCVLCMRRGRGEILVIRLGAGCVCYAMAVLACVVVCAAGNARPTKRLISVAGE